MVRLVCAAVLAAGMCGIVAADPPPPPGDPCAPAEVLTDLLAEGAELDGNEFDVPVSWTGKVAPRVVIFEPTNAKVIYGAANAVQAPDPFPSWLWIATFKGHVNRQVIVYAYVPNSKIGTPGVKVNIVNNPGP